MARKQDQDPYAPPPMHHDHSGAVLRVAVIALLLGGAVWGYTIYTNQPETPLVADAAQELQMADASSTAPATIPEATSESLPQAAPAPAAARAPVPRRTTRPPAAEPPPAEPVPPPSTSSAPTTPTPIPPMDLPPAG